MSQIAHGARNDNLVNSVQLLLPSPGTEGRPWREAQTRSESWANMFKINRFPASRIAAFAFVAGALLQSGPAPAQTVAEPQGAPTRMLGQLYLNGLARMAK